MSRASVLIVEDEMLIRMMLAEMIEDIGLSVEAQAAGLGEGLALAQDATFDLAILDVNLAGESVRPIAELLAKKNLPFVFASGYGAVGIPEPFNDRPILQKPFQQEDLANVVLAALGGRLPLADLGTCASTPDQRDRE